MFYVWFRTEKSRMYRQPDSFDMFAVQRPSHDFSPRLEAIELDT